MAYSLDLRKKVIEYRKTHTLDETYTTFGISKANSDRCYGLTADENYLLVCEYGENGTDAEIIVYQKRRNHHE